MESDSVRMNICLSDGLPNLHGADFNWIYLWHVSQCKLIDGADFSLSGSLS